MTAKGEYAWRDTAQAGPVPAMPPGMGPPPPIPPYPHDTEFSVITVGTGNPQPNLERASACTMLQFKGAYYVVDMGNGAQNSMLRGAKGTFPFRHIAALCFTHFHQDHTNDYFDIMTNRWLTGGKEVTVVGPPGVAALHGFFVTFFKDDLCYRWLREIPRGLTGTGMFEGVTVKEITGAQQFQLGELQVRTAKLTHTMYDLGYRFEWADKSVVVSGDTSFDERLVGLAAGADVLVVDGDERWGGAPEHTMAPLEALEPRFRPVGEYGGDFAVRPHATLEEIAVMAAAAEVKHLVVTHLRAGQVDEVAVRAGLRAGGFTGRVTVAADGMEIAV
jgi:ribonuclease BN (tRNA processing enzyme)